MPLINAAELASPSLSTMRYRLPNRFTGVCF